MQVSHSLLPTPSDCSQQSLRRGQSTPAHLEEQLVTENRLRIEKNIRDRTICVYIDGNRPLLTNRESGLQNGLPSNNTWISDKNTQHQGYCALKNYYGLDGLSNGYYFRRHGPS